MRIAVIYDCLFPASTGGGERQYLGFATHLHRRGHEVEYLTAQQDAQVMSGTPFATSAVTGPLRLYDRSGVRRSSAALRFAFGVFRALRRRRRSLDAVLVSGLPVLNVFAARVALLGSGVQITIDYLEVWRRRQWLEYAGPITGTIAWLLQRIAVAWTPVASCHSDLSARRLRAEGLRGPILVSKGLIDQQSVPPFRAQSDEPPFVLYVGRHIPDKDVQVIPAAVQVARASIPDLRLIILGSGPSTDAIRSSVDDVGGWMWTSMPGFVDQAELDRRMAGAACLVNPSRREGYGLVVVEANAHGTPVVLVDHEGNAAVELVDEGVNGRIAASSAPDVLGASIATAVLGGPALRASARSWFMHAVETRTIAASVEAIEAQWSEVRE